MNVVLWILQLVLAFMALMAGSMKVAKSKVEMAEQMAWVEGFSQNTIKAIGALELLGAVGLILPAITGVAPVLVPLAATGLGLNMVGATAVHIRRSEIPNATITITLLVIAAVVAWGRFGDYGF
jgi:uncharacterized membrane protein YphA (DoxX/SURF4 family)